MKRSRDDVCDSPQPKRPVVTSPAKLLGQSQAIGEGRDQRLTHYDALSYLKAVKTIFEKKMDKYDEFLEVVKDFKAQRIDSSGILTRVKDLFRGHQDLILGFSRFLPKENITLPLEDGPPLTKKRVQFKEAYTFVKKLEARSRGDNNMYKSFRGIMNMFKIGSKSLAEVKQEMSVVLRDHPDLLSGFTHFLPINSAAAVANFAQAGRNLSHRDYRHSPMTSAKANRAFCAEGPDPDFEETLARSDKNQRWHAEFESVRRHYRDRKEQEFDKRDPSHDGMQHAQHKRKSTPMEDCAADHFHQAGEGIAHNGSHFTDIPFLTKVIQVCNPRLPRLMSCLWDFNNRDLTELQFQKLAWDIFGGYPELTEELNEFLAHCIEIDGYVAAIFSKRLHNDGLVFGSAKVNSSNRARGSCEDRNKDHDKREGNRNDRGTTISSPEVAGQKMPLYPRDKYQQKSIQKLDLSNCERCTPSYRLLPKNYLIPSVSQRTEIGAEVLNDHWVSVTSGSEDYSSKHMRKNKYEESLFRCEDDRFELDMLLESVNTTTKCVEEFLEKINKNDIDTDPPIHIEDHFTALNLRCIERLYGDHGLDVMDVLRKNAHLAFPVILTRLKQKQEEWARCRSDFNKVWAEIYTKNYHKSLDYRSFYFKQQDAKSLSTKALLVEIKEIRKKKTREDDELLRRVAGSRHAIYPHIEYDFLDPDVHEDLYQIIRYSCQEMCSRELLDKVMKIWTTFLEPFLGVPHQLHGAEDSEDIDKGNSADESVREGDLGSGARDFANQNLSNRLIDETPSRLCVGNDVNVTKVVHHTAEYSENKSDNLCDPPQHGELQSETNVVNGANHISKQAPSSEQLTEANAAPVENQGRIYAENLSGPFSAPIGPLDINVESAPGMHLSGDYQGDVCKRTIPSSSETVTQGTGAQEGYDQSMAHRNAEKEEGVLTSNGDSDVENVAARGSCATDTACNTEDDSANRKLEIAHNEETCGDAREHSAGAEDDGDDISHRSTEVRDNVSQNADVSGSDSGDAEDCLPEEPGEDGAHDPDGAGTLLPLSERYLQTLRPLNLHVPLALQDMGKDSCIFYGNDSFFVLFRLHQTLYERVQKAKVLSSFAENRWRVSNYMTPTNTYARFINALYSLLDGSSENAKFEDDCRSILGTQSYILFTLDKLIYKLVKQLQAIAMDEVGTRLIHLYAYENLRTPTRFTDVVYHANARFILPHGNIYRIERSSTPLRLLSIQLMDSQHDTPEDTAVCMDPEFSAYLYNKFLSVAPEERESRGVYLKRNKRKTAQGEESDALCEAIDGVIVINGLWSKMRCSTSKVSYVHDTEDFSYRMKKRRKIFYRYVSSNGLSAKRRRRARSILLS